MPACLTFRCTKSILFTGLLWSAAFAAIAPSSLADEIRLKDGKKLYGVIVAYEENMFKVKTDFGYVLVEKDKIASIIPTTPAAEGSNAAAQSTAQKPGEAQARTSSSASRAGGAISRQDAAKFIDSAASQKVPRVPIITNAAASVRPALPTATKMAAAIAPNLKPTLAPRSALDEVLAAEPPKEPEPEGNREEVQGNLYINYSNGFRMYKAPSWQLIEDARSALPNAIVAMGTSDESTLLVVGRETSKGTLSAAAKMVESRLQDVYDNYQQISQRKATVGGLPAFEIRYQGKADDHDWSGTLVVVARGDELLTILGMTYADSDLIQIQENVISRAIASLNFTTR